MWHPHPIPVTLRKWNANLISYEAIIIKMKNDLIVNRNESGSD